MRHYYLHLTYYDGNDWAALTSRIIGNTEDAQTTLIEVVVPRMEAALTEALGWLPAEREWWVESYKLPDPVGTVYAAPGSLKAEFRLADNGRKKGLLE